MRTSIIVAIVVASVLVVAAVGVGIGLGVYFAIKTQQSSGTTITTTTTTRSLQTGTLPTQSSCGKQSIAPSISGSTLNRILGGSEAVANSWPWMVSLRYYVGNKISTHFCGGSLIYEQYVLTAAHCLTEYSASELAVVVGINNIQSTVSTSSVYYASDSIYHYSYDSSTTYSFINDIGVIKLKTPVTLSSTVALLCLPNSSSNANDVLNKNTALAGWGSIAGTNSANDLASNLKQTTLKVVNGNSICNSVGYDTSKQYCAYDSVNYSNACFGDSGGPLMYYTNNAWYSYGIVSFIISNDNGNCDPTQPSYYTQTAAYLDYLGNAIATLV